MSTEAQTIAQTTLTTVAAMAPQLAASDPKAAVAVALAPLALNLIQAATAAHQAGLITDADLASYWASTNAGYQSAHARWNAMNAADAGKS